MDPEADVLDYESTKAQMKAIIEKSDQFTDDLRVAVKRAEELRGLTNDPEIIAQLDVIITSKRDDIVKLSARAECIEKTTDVIHKELMELIEDQERNQKKAVFVILILIIYYCGWYYVYTN